MTNHQIIHGDASEVLPTLDVKANLILTSPPYDNLRDYGGHGFDFDRMADACVGALAEGGVIVWVVADATVDGSETGTSFRQALGFMERGLKLYQTLHYVKSRELALMPNRCAAVSEYMFVFSLGKPSTTNIIRDKKNIQAGLTKIVGQMGRNANGDRSRDAKVTIAQYGMRTNLWRYISGGKKDTGNHPAPFPIALAQDHITTWTNPGDLVLDPMAGSGTVSRAAKDLGRNSIAIEIHEPYVDLIRRRMAQEVMELV